MLHTKFQAPEPSSSEEEDFLIFSIQTQDPWGGTILDRLLFVVALLFYVHGKHLRSCRDGQLTLPHFSWAGLDLLVLRAHTFASN